MADASAPTKLNVFSNVTFDEVYEALNPYWPDKPQEKYSPWTKEKTPGQIRYVWFGLRFGVPAYTFSKNTLETKDPPPFILSLMDKLYALMPDVWEFDAVLANHCLEEASLGEHRDNEAMHVPGDIVSVSFTKESDYERRFFYREDGKIIDMPLKHGDVFRGRLDLLPHGLKKPLKHGKSESIVLTFRRTKLANVPHHLRKFTLL